MPIKQTNKQTNDNESKTDIFQKYKKKTFFRIAVLSTRKYKYSHTLKLKENGLSMHEGDSKQGKWLSFCLCLMWLEECLWRYTEEEKGANNVPLIYKYHMKGNNSKQYGRNFFGGEINRLYTHCPLLQCSLAGLLDLIKTKNPRKKISFDLMRNTFKKT